MFFFVLILLWFLFDFYSRTKLEEACSDWPLINRNLADFLQIFPTTSANDSAQSLSKLYGEIRYDISADPAQKDNQSISEDYSVTSTMHSRCWEYLNREFEKPTGSVVEPEPGIIKVLQQNQNILDRIVFLLLEKPPLEFEFNAGLKPTDGMPYLAWPIKLNHLLITQALSFRLHGQNDQAWSYIHAAAILADSSFSQPNIVKQFIAIAEAKMILLAMRKMPTPIPEWALGWPAQDLEYTMMMAYTQEARSLLTVAESCKILDLIKKVNETYIVDYGMESIKIGLVTRVLSTLVERQYLRIYSAYYIAAWKQSIKERVQEGLCVTQPLSLPPLQEQIPEWILSSDLSNAINTGSIMYDLYNKIWFQLHRLMFYISGTNTILASKEAKAASNLKQWLETLPRTDLTCEIFAWSYAVTPEGTGTFEFSKPLPEGAVYEEISKGHLKYF